MHEAIALELRLLEPETRADPAAVEALLHADFREFATRSSRRWPRTRAASAGCRA
jgi:hypothetical protein